jgi:hypothetical protein
MALKPYDASQPKVHHRPKHVVHNNTHNKTTATKTDDVKKSQQWNLAGTRATGAARPAAHAGRAPPATTAAAATGAAASAMRDSPDKLRASARALSALPAGEAHDAGVEQVMSRAKTLFNGMSAKERGNQSLTDLRTELTGLAKTNEWSPSKPREFEASYPLENPDAAREAMNQHFNNDNNWLSVPNMSASPHEGSANEREIRINGTDGKPGDPIIERRTDDGTNPNVQSYGIDKALPFVAQNYKAEWRIENGPDGKPSLHVKATWQDPDKAGHDQNPEAYTFSGFHGLLGNVMSNAAASMNRASHEN